MKISSDAQSNYRLFSLYLYSPVILSYFKQRFVLALQLQKYARSMNKKLRVHCPRRRHRTRITKIDLLQICNSDIENLARRSCVDTPENLT